MHGSFGWTDALFICPVKQSIHALRLQLVPISLLVLIFNWRIVEGWSARGKLGWVKLYEPVEPNIVVFTNLIDRIFTALVECRLKIKQPASWGKKMLINMIRT